ncbi:MAG: ATP-binding protein [Bdellovibrionales bacterium]
MKIDRTIKEKWFKRALRVAAAMLIGTLIYQLPLDYMEAFTYDFRIALKPTSPISGKIATVAIDTATLKTLQKEPTAADHRRVLEKLLRHGATKIIYIMDPTTIEGSRQDKQALAEVMKDPRVVVAVNELPPAGQLDFLRLAAPFDQTAVLPGPTTVDKTILAKDGVTRRLIVSSEGQATYPFLLAEELYGQKENEFKGQFELLEAQQAYIDYHPEGTYQPYEFVMVRDGNIDKLAFDKKIVMIGRDSRDSVKEYVMTPYSREVTAMSMLEMHANMLDTVLQNRAPRQLSGPINLIFTILFSLLTVYVVLNVRPLRGLGILGVALGTFVVVAYLLFAAFNFWLPMAQPLLATFVGYYFFIPYRLIMENRRSWEYYQKNKLLTQVEELKSNFLRMMSHDLRTPLARIQGMANVVLSDSTPLSDTQRRAVETIYRSSEELSDFIGSILSLGRIESKEIKLHLRSRDLNSLLREVIKKCEFLARKRGIEIRTEFEPMFSFKVDEDLIRQVFTNLIENAIKYSGDNGKILVSTEEVEGRAVVQVADQGIGIPHDDLPHVFDKFFRSRNARHTEVGGSGLGLYLVKYFVELHRGQVEVESESGKGSTFTVKLPMVMDTQTRAPLREGVHHV